ncbi:hypothetical protein KW797_02305 [Candidatus Parcubacteria bacterium]|nr:hypothetical protein [Candidatus Parcubacteria bacterium]
MSSPAAATLEVFSTATDSSRDQRWSEVFKSAVGASPLPPTKPEDLHAALVSLIEERTKSLRKLLTRASLDIHCRSHRTSFQACKESECVEARNALLNSLLFKEASK